MLLRLSRLIHHRFGERLDFLMSYSHYHLLNTRFADFAPHFTPHVSQLLCASPLNMGFFSPSIPWWSPAPPRYARREGPS